MIVSFIGPGDELVVWDKIIKRLYPLELPRMDMISVTGL